MNAKIFFQFSYLLLSMDGKMDGRRVGLMGRMEEGMQEPFRDILNFLFYTFSPLITAH